ncbi:LOW QUALITY PROTEIN: chitin deacetylase 1-like [Pollicipes pollicipes]|uniref:LOW QUALITY PROTEIN: chitin deacetylase 1-like n=1 Tax=Pollicipes pollicipes TaxID=41117 RepID=UPI001884AB01|nr:LOW QUALITY PROTEIN: chitin deacetylase 1-like [Pollicipes pollicipes]
MRPAAVLLALLVCAASANRVKRQDAEGTEEEAIKAICTDKTAGEWFRLNAGAASCNKVVQCTAAGLQQLKCPTGLAFDLKGQTCDWKASVQDCELKQRPKLARPQFNTEDPLCLDANELACGDNTCLARELFCDGNVDCTDGSDENICDRENDPNRAPPCDPTTCQLPSCFCSELGTTVPGGLAPADVPQMIMITFNGAINNNNIDLFDDLFLRAGVNPNGCPIKGTFFVSHKYTNYTAVQDLHNRGHEIAVFSITQNDEVNFWSNASRTDWSKEMAGQRFIIEKFSAIDDNSVVGMRTPYLRVGGNNQFFMMKDQSFLYDSTITAPLSDIPIWPYTLLNQMPHACHGNAQKCPTRAFPVWEMVMNELDRREDPSVDDNLPGCAQVDSCSNILNGEQFYNFLNHNFDRHYLTNRAPLSLNFHSAWLKKEEYLDYLLYFIQEIQETFPDAYFVTMTQVIEWMQSPLTIAETANFDLWKTKCEEPLGFPCSKPGGNNCALRASGVQGTFNMQTCLRCPNDFPWLNDPTGDGTL